VYAVGGPREVFDLLRSYLVDQSQSGSVVMGAEARGWIYQVKRLVIWNGLAVLEWIWAVPLFLAAKERMKLVSAHTAFLLLWLVPGLIAQALIHVAAPGHTLFSIPALCLIGGYVLRAGLQRWAVWDAGLIASVAASLMLFLHFVPLPSADSRGGSWDAFAVTTFETSLENIRWLDDIHGGTLKEIRSLTIPEKKTIILIQDRPRRDWFLNKRIADYYLPHEEMRLLADRDQPSAENSETIPVPRHSRLLWVLETGGRLHIALSKTNLARGGPRVLYTDIEDDTMAFSVADFRIVPQP
jgi:hypothetical protein